MTAYNLARLGGTSTRHRPVQHQHRQTALEDAAAGQQSDVLQMNVFIVLAHPESQSINGALFRTAVMTLQAAGHAVKTSDLYAMHFDPVSDRRNFTTVQDPDYFKQQLEEIHATELDGFVLEIEAEMQKLEWCDLMIWQFPLWWFSVLAILKG